MGNTRNSIKVVAAFEAFEGVLALVAASGLLLLLHKDLQDLAFQLVGHAHLNPAAHYPSIFITAADHLENTNFTLIAIGAILYALFRFVEASGLYREAAWAEVLAAFSSALYIPFEVVEIMRHVSLISVGVLVLNIAVVFITVVALMQHRKPQGKNMNTSLRPPAST
jgi:uncharacterized membrane protein (DUF2068 family)